MSIESTNITFLQRLRIFIFYFRKKLEDDGSLIGEADQDGSKILNKEKPEESKFINI